MEGGKMGCFKMKQILLLRHLENRDGREKSYGGRAKEEATEEGANLSILTNDRCGISKMFQNCTITTGTVC